MTEDRDGSTALLARCEAACDALTVLELAPRWGMEELEELTRTGRGVFRALERAVDVGVGSGAGFVRLKDVQRSIRLLLERDDVLRAVRDHTDVGSTDPTAVLDRRASIGSVDLDFAGRSGLLGCCVALAYGLETRRGGRSVAVMPWWCWRTLGIAAVEEVLLGPEGADPAVQETAARLVLDGMGVRAALEVAVALERE